MKKISTDTIGGRIRALRTHSEISIKDLAKAVDITPHYLSTIEVGGKMPSDTLIRRISDVLKVSREYIKNGGDMPQGIKRPAPENTGRKMELKPSSAYDIDSAVLLEIAGGLVPSDEAEKLKSMQLEDILEFLIHHKDADVSDAMREISRIYDTLQHIYQTQKLRDALRDFMIQKSGACRRITPDTREQKEFTCDDGTSFRVDARIIRIRIQDTTRCFQYLYLDSVTKEQAKAILEQKSNYGGVLYMVFTSKQLWRDFCQYANDIYDESESIYSYTVTSLIQIDTIRKDKWEIRSENEVFIDFETMTGIPMEDLLEEY